LLKIVYLKYFFVYRREENVIFYGTCGH
jgi:hypothetical protein